MSSVFRSLNKIPQNQMQHKFRGCLLGALTGDCLGAPFEGQTVSSGDKIIIQRYFDKMEDPNFISKSPFKKYTDDTAMLKSIANFLIDKPEPDYKYLARLFVNEYFKQPYRGYGQNVITVFEKLKNTKYQDIFQPAKEQFNGRGSYGNGGAMRIAPIALFFHDNYENMLNVARESTKITHYNTLGINGAILQCLAVNQALLATNTEKFCDHLMEKIRKIELECLDEDDEIETPYYDKLKIVKNLLLLNDEDNNSSNFDDEEVIPKLGNGISAYESVPTAIYCFLRAHTPIPKIETTNQFRRTIQYAISLGGDTDTIASMAGAIVGAYLGEEIINKSLLKHCEKYEDIIDLADKLYERK